MRQTLLALQHLQLKHLHIKVSIACHACASCKHLVCARGTQHHHSPLRVVVLQQLEHLLQTGCVEVCVPNAWNRQAAVGQRVVNSARQEVSRTVWGLPARSQDRPAPSFERVCVTCASIRRHLFRAARAGPGGFHACWHWSDGCRFPGGPGTWHQGLRAACR